MRRFISVIGALVIVAGCVGATSTPTTAPTSEPLATPAPTVVPTAKPTAKPSPTLVSARVAFDGHACTYTGPAVVTAPATLMLEYAPTKETYGLSLGTILSTTTLAEVKAIDNDPAYGPAPGHKTPEWLLTSTWHALFGTGTIEYDLRILTVFGRAYDQVSIGCTLNPWTSDMPADTVEGHVTAAVIRLVPN